MKILYTGGTFDLFHAGHVNFLRQCSKLANRVVVGLNTDDFITKYKKEPPVLSYEQRESVLLSCKYVEKVVPNLSGEDSKPTILSIRPDIIAVGDDWAKKDYYKQMNFTKEWIEDNHMVLVYIPYTDSITTTEIKNKIKGVYNV